MTHSPVGHIRIQLDVTKENGDVVTYVFHKVDTSGLDGRCDLKVVPIYPDISALPLARVPFADAQELILTLRGRLLSIDDTNRETHRITWPVESHTLAPKPANGGDGHTPGIGWMCTACDWRFSYDVPEARAREVWLDDVRHKVIA